MKFSHAIVAVFDDHDAADAAVKALATSGFELRRLSVVGKGFQPSEPLTPRRITVDHADRFQNAPPRQLDRELPVPAAIQRASIDAVA